jgi:polyketide cyclase/dehydrase/lipid transport protein
VAIDTRAVILVARAREEVAAYLRDPGNDPDWIGGLRSARLVTEPPVGVGSRIERVASFLGRRIEYVNEIIELTGTRLAMRSIRSPFPMRVTYGYDDVGDDATTTTEVSVRVEGDASRLYRLADPLLAVLVRRSVQRDLRTLKRLLEDGAGHRQRMAK